MSTRLVYGLHSRDCVLLRASREAKSGPVRSGHPFALRWRLGGFAQEGPYIYRITPLLLFHVGLRTCLGQVATDGRMETISCKGVVQNLCSLVALLIPSRARGTLRRPMIDSAPSMAPKGTGARGAVDECRRREGAAKHEGERCRGTDRTWSIQLEWQLAWHCAVEARRLCCSVPCDRLDRGPRSHERPKTTVHV